MRITIEGSVPLAISVRSLLKLIIWLFAVLSGAATWSHADEPRPEASTRTEALTMAAFMARFDKMRRCARGSPKTLAPFCANSASIRHQSICRTSSPKPRYNGFKTTGPRVWTLPCRRLATDHRASTRLRAAFHPAKAMKK